MRQIFTGAIASITILAMGFFVWTAVHALFYAPDSEINVPHASVVLASEARKPLRIQIPSLGIDAKVQEVGITKTYSMGVPSNFQDVGWYKYGPVPGHVGSAVI